MREATEAPSRLPSLPLAGLFARGLLGLLFGMLGWHKVFAMGPVEHARRFFVEGYAETWIPLWALWAVGAAIPFVELLGGGLVLVGLRFRAALALLALDLLVVTYGHMLAEPFFDVTTHVAPRGALVLLLLLLPARAHRWSLDSALGRGSGGG
ncbi:MAG: hypothetical protein GWM92_19305 [Gemmatimonadetes bacterium]|nr:hypothetical protein [Gemmatimonadota bacterium]NIR80951.1 hypothetical protein [Gemmatimonadota bacterium]NIT89769.1 hypothetical protein [Gemmatimonadota bacterium]NIU33555.1 hypothetical protein [Gemmatimonadota bacterium]NIU37824.1 hypothetical protein [Gemmatimonadota bacterium]